MVENTNIVSGGRSPLTVLALRMFIVRGAFGKEMSFITYTKNWLTRYYFEVFEVIVYMKSVC